MNISKSPNVLDINGVVGCEHQNWVCEKFYCISPSPNELIQFEILFSDSLNFSSGGPEIVFKLGLHLMALFFW